MTFIVWIEPHERAEAIEAYRSRLTDEQIEQIWDAPEDARVRVTLDGKTKVYVEGQPAP